jgi:hypothetical protein
VPARTPEEISDELRRIRALVKGGRNEAMAHSWIDELYVETLHAIAAGNRDAPQLAREALKAEQIVFERRFDR